jgi:hypothetical protein
MGQYEEETNFDVIVKIAKVTSERNCSRAACVRCINVDHLGREGALSLIAAWSCSLVVYQEILVWSIHTSQKSKKFSLNCLQKIRRQVRTGNEKKPRSLDFVSSTSGGVVACFQEQLRTTITFDGVEVIVGFW